MEKTTALLALLAAASGLLGTLTRYTVKGWKAISLVMAKIDDTAERVSKLERGLKVSEQKATVERQEIREKLNGG